MTCKTQPEALRLADQLYSRARNEASRRNSAYDVFGMDNTPENTHPLETAAAAELRRLHAENEALKKERDALRDYFAALAMQAHDAAKALLAKEGGK